MNANQADINGTVPPFPRLHRPHRRDPGPVTGPSSCAAALRCASPIATAAAARPCSTMRRTAWSATTWPIPSGPAHRLSDPGPCDLLGHGPHPDGLSPGDTCGWHDTISGVSSAPALVRERWTARRATRSIAKACHRDGREGCSSSNWANGAWGRKDLVANLNFFSKVGGGRRRDAWPSSPGHSKPGASVDLRAEMDTLVVLNTLPPTPWTPTRSGAPRPMELAPLPDRPGRPTPPTPVLSQLSWQNGWGLCQHRHLPLPVLRAPP